MVTRNSHAQSMKLIPDFYKRRLSAITSFAWLRKTKQVMAFSFVDELELKDYAMFLSKVFFLVALIFSWIRNNYILFIY